MWLHVCVLLLGAYMRVCVCVVYMLPVRVPAWMEYIYVCVCVCELCSRLGYSKWRRHFACSRACAHTDLSTIIAEWIPRRKPLCFVANFAFAFSLLTADTSINRYLAIPLPRQFCVCKHIEGITSGCYGEVRCMRVCVLSTFTRGLFLDISLTQLNICAQSYDHSKRSVIFCLFIGWFFLYFVRILKLKQTLETELSELVWLITRKRLISSEFLIRFVWRKYTFFMKTSKCS